MRFKLIIAAAAAAAALAGCGRDQANGQLTAEERRQLENAAGMLDDNMIDVSPDSLVANDLDFEDEPPSEATDDR